VENSLEYGFSLNDLSWRYVLESEKSNMPEPKKTTEGKWRCPIDNKEYNSKEDYEAHCKEEHTSGW
jgi:hypothetical protein